jgi:5-methylcytosine-specific restriction endonuclease McrA
LAEIGRGCLDCGIRFIPARSRSNSRCNNCEGVRRSREAYNDPQYRKLRSLLLSAAVTCAICGKGKEKDNPFTIDHILPVSKKGSNDPDNMRVAHLKCNSKRGNKT